MSEKNLGTAGVAYSKEKDPGSIESCSKTQKKKKISPNDALNHFLKHHKYFSVPNLPYGNWLDFVLYSNWGSKRSIGLCGIEIFD
jgi:hypothetical protein